MSLEAALQENTKALRELLATLSKGVPTTAAQVQAVVTEAKTEKVATAKKTQAAASQEQPTQTVAASSENSTPATPANTTDEVAAPTYQDAAAVITKLSRTKGRDTAVALLSKFGAAKLPDVKPEQFAAVIADATAAMGE